MSGSFGAILPSAWVVVLRCCCSFRPLRVSTFLSISATEAACTLLLSFAEASHHHNHNNNNNNNDNNNNNNHHHHHHDDDDDDDDNNDVDSCLIHAMSSQSLSCERNRRTWKLLVCYWGLYRSYYRDP